MAAINIATPLETMTETSVSSSRVQPQSGVRKTSLLRLDDEFRRAVPPDERALAERTVGAMTYTLAAGPWDPSRLTSGSAPPIAALVIDGLITCDIGLAGSATAHIFGPGDLLPPWGAISDVLPTTARFMISRGGAIVALLTEDFRRAAHRWPDLALCLQRRYAQQADARLVRITIAGLPRVEQRVLALLWHLAERFGTVHADGVHVHLKFTHELLGRLAAAKRPTISLALTTLAAEGAVRQCDDGWLISHESAARLKSVAPSSSGAPAALRSASSSRRKTTAGRNARA